MKYAPLLTLLLIYGYTGDSSFGASSSLHTMPSASVKSSFSSWFTNKSTTRSPAKIHLDSRKAVSGEIWSRVRNHFKLSPKSTPIYRSHLKSYSRSQDYINMVVKNASPYFYFVVEEVEKRGMPAEIALLPIIESDFNPHCRSNKGAVGLWQIMPFHGLNKKGGYDERKDVYKSTKVALDYLSYLHKKFNGNWPLALAAYNSGEGKVLRAIKKNKSAKKPTDFWSLKLPKQTMDFVPKLMALATIVKSPKEYGVHIPPIANKPVFTRVDAQKTVNIPNLAKQSHISESYLRVLNPGLPKQTTVSNV